MDRIATAIEHGIRGAQTQRIKGGGGGATRVLARLRGVEIKIETSPVTRGVVHDPETRSVSEAVEDKFGYAEMKNVSRLKTCLAASCTRLLTASIRAISMT